MHHEAVQAVVIVRLDKVVFRSSPFLPSSNMAVIDFSFAPDETKI